MKIATLNIDWAKKGRVKNHFKTIENFLNQQNFDFLILTEAIDLNLVNFKFKYFSEQIPENITFENINYTEYLKNEKAFRTIIYSNKKCIKNLNTTDAKTSCAFEFETDLGNIVIYATIIGTLFRKQPSAKNELENCINDCKELYQSNSNLIVVGDLNTSFLKNEPEFCINKETTKSLKNLFGKLNLYNATEGIEKNIDHIIIPEKFKNRLLQSSIFVEKNVLSDHQGVCIELI